MTAQKSLTASLEADVNKAFFFEYYNDQFQKAGWTDQLMIEVYSWLTQSKNDYAKTPIEDNSNFGGFLFALVAPSVVLALLPPLNVLIAPVIAFTIVSGIAGKFIHDGLRKDAKAEMKKDEDVLLERYTSEIAMPRYTREMSEANFPAQKQIVEGKIALHHATATALRAQRQRDVYEVSVYGGDTEISLAKNARDGVQKSIETLAKKSGLRIEFRDAATPAENNSLIIDMPREFAHRVEGVPNVRSVNKLEVN